MSVYTIVDERDIENHIKFYRIQPADIKITLGEVLQSLSDLAWITEFDEEDTREGYQIRAAATIEYISNNIITSQSDEITDDSGEYVVSELSKRVVVENLDHANIPLAELFKGKRIGNHGFDFYSICPQKHIHFGEAKFNSTSSAFASAMEQINRFVNEEKKDVSDMIDIRDFCCKASRSNFNSGAKGFVAGFSCKSTSTDRLIEFIKSSPHYPKFKEHKHLICVAVNL